MYTGANGGGGGTPYGVSPQYEVCVQGLVVGGGGTSYGVSPQYEVCMQYAI